MRKLILRAAVLLLGIAGISPGQTKSKPQAPAPTRAPTTAKPIRYAKRGLPARRIGSAVRGGGDIVRVLGPRDHVGRSLSPTPVLFWVFMGDSVDSPTRVAEVTVAGGGQTRTMRLDPVKPWVPSAIDMSKLGWRLGPGVEYVWSVRMIDGTKDGDTAVVRVAPAAERPHVDVSAEGLFAVRSLAEAGVWYDALAKLQALIDDRSQGDAAGLRALRDGLLDHELRLPPLKW